MEQDSSNPFDFFMTSVNMGYIFNDDANVLPLSIRYKSILQNIRLGVFSHSEEKVRH